MFSLVYLFSYKAWVFLHIISFNITVYYHIHICISSCVHNNIHLSCVKIDKQFCNLLSLAEIKEDAVID